MCRKSTSAVGVGHGNLALLSRPTNPAGRSASYLRACRKMCSTAFAAPLPTVRPALLFGWINCPPSRTMCSETKWKPFCARHLQGPQPGRPPHFGKINAQAQALTQPQRAAWGLLFVGGASRPFYTLRMRYGNETPIFIQTLHGRTAGLPRPAGPIPQEGPASCTLNRQADPCIKFDAPMQGSSPPLGNFAALWKRLTRGVPDLCGRAPVRYKAV